MAVLSELHPSSSLLESLLFRVCCSPASLGRFRNRCSAGHTSLPPTALPQSRSAPLTRLTDPSRCCHLHPQNKTISRLLNKKKINPNIYIIIHCKLNITEVFFLFQAIFKKKYVFFLFWQSTIQHLFILYRLVIYKLKRNLKSRKVAILQRNGLSINLFLLYSFLCVFMCKWYFMWVSCSCSSF